MKKNKYGVKVTDKRTNCFLGWLYHNGEHVCRPIFPFVSFNEAVSISHTSLAHETMTIISKTEQL